jgi:hypothetical protein
VPVLSPERRARRWVYRNGFSKKLPRRRRRTLSGRNTRGCEIT